MAKLPEEQRSVILLVGLEGMRYEEVAEVLGVPVGTIRSRLSRGRESLRRLMGIVPDRHAELIMADPALLKLASKRFPDRAPIAALGKERALHPAEAAAARRGKIGRTPGADLNGARAIVPENAPGNFVRASSFLQQAATCGCRRARTLALNPWSGLAKSPCRGFATRSLDPGSARR